MKSANLGPQFVGFSWVLLLKLGRGTLVSSLQRALLREQAGKRWVTCFLYRCYQILPTRQWKHSFPIPQHEKPRLRAAMQRLDTDRPRRSLHDRAKPIGFPLGFPLSELGSISNCAAFGSPIESTSTAGFQRKIVWLCLIYKRNQGRPQDPLGYDAWYMHSRKPTHRESWSCSHGFTMGDLMFTPVTGNDPIRANMIESTQLQTFPNLPAVNPGLEAFKMAAGRRSTGSGTAPALYNDITTTAISITAERSGHCVCASVHFADEPFQRGTGFKSAAKSKEWKSQERLHISNVLRWSKSPSHLGMAQLRITTTHH